MNCPKCGSELDRKYAYCPNCGNPLTVAKQNVISKKRYAAAFILVIVGVIIGWSMINDPTPPSPKYSATDSAYVTATDGLILLNKRVEDNFLTGTVKNTSDKQFKHVNIQFNLYDKSGAKIGNTFDNAYNLNGQTEWKFKILVNDRAYRADLSKLYGE